MGIGLILPWEWPRWPERPKTEIDTNVESDFVLDAWALFRSCWIGRTAQRRLGVIRRHYISKVIPFLLLLHFWFSFLKLFRFELLLKTLWPQAIGGSVPWRPAFEDRGGSWICSSYHYVICTDHMTILQKYVHLQRTLSLCGVHRSYEQYSIYILYMCPRSARDPLFDQRIPPVDDSSDQIWKFS